MNSLKKNSLIKEQNKSVLMIACVILVVICVAGVCTYFISNDRSTNNSNSDNLVNDDGIVNDMEGFRSKK